MSEKKEVPRSVAFSRDLWEAIRLSADHNGRKLADQVRYLIEKGLQVEEGEDVSSRVHTLEAEVHAMREQMAQYLPVPKQSQKKAAS